MLVRFVRGRHQEGGIGVALASLVVVFSLVSTSTPEGFRVWVGGLVVPLLLFAGLQSIDEVELRQARTVVRWTLFAVVSLHVALYGLTAGSGLVSPSFFFDHHDDLMFWETVGGRLLGNPNNASVIFCTAFAWSVAELAAKQHRMLPRSFLAVSALAILSTGSRGAIVTMLATALVGSFVMVNGLRRTRTLVLLGTGTVAGAYYWLGTLASQSAHRSGRRNRKVVRESCLRAGSFVSPFRHWARDDSWRTAPEPRAHL